MSQLVSRLTALVSPHTFLKTQIASILVAVALGVTIILYVTGTVERNLKAAVNETGGAFVISKAEARLGDLLSVLDRQAGAFLSSREFAALPPEQQDTVRNELFRDNFGSAGPGPPDLQIPLSLSQAVTLQRTIDSLIRDVQPLSQSSGQPEAQLLAATASTIPLLDHYFQQASAENFRALRSQIVQLRQQAKAAASGLSDDALAHHSALGGALSLLKVVIPVGAVLTSAALIAMTFVVGKHIADAFLALEGERVALVQATQALSQRNDQLRALYNVFSEITDTLNMKYIVTATLREIFRLVDAQAVVLRLIQNEEMRVAGSLADTGEAVPNLSTVHLGEGLLGRVAKRGKTLRIDRDAESQMSEGQRLAGAESGIIVPLIVGARVVGTLGCWSRRAQAFSQDDERILEMLASQVATAIAAADLTESSERRAQNDALTGLPNRRQLIEDIVGPLRELALNQRPAVIAMLDIDHFKRFNDDFGHRVGDVTLQRVASVLRASIRENDRVYRYGGEEFLIIYADAKIEEAVSLAERVRVALQSTPFTGDALEPVGPVTISIGLAAMPDHGHDINSLIELADNAMYRSKQAGRNCVTLWGEHLEKSPIAA